LTPRAPRDFLLDAHGLTVLSSETSQAMAWITFIDGTFPGSVFWVTDLVIIEAKTGSPAKDAKVNRFLNTLDDPARPDRRRADPTPADLTRAAALRTRAMAQTGDRITATDALIAALGVRMAGSRGVTILTSDPRDLTLMTGYANLRNLSVASATHPPSPT
jgi:hypothetical protein